VADLEAGADQAGIRRSLEAVLAYAEREEFRGYGKHDALNSPFLKALTFNRKWPRIMAIQAVMRAPVNLRPWLGVRRYRNPKGIALFARALLRLSRLTGEGGHRETARSLLDWLAQNPAQGYSGPGWGYLWDWQDLGFFAPFGSPNCVVTAFVGQALLDGCLALEEERYLRLARGAVEFILRDLKVLYEDEDKKCLAYVPGAGVTMRVMDVSALAGAFLARVDRLTGQRELAGEARRLLGYVVDKQTPEGGWYYTDPPEDSPLKIDNYHTGFILEALLDYELATGDRSFRGAYERGLRFYAGRLFLPDGAPRWMSHRTLPLDIHGAATGIGTLARASVHHDRAYLEPARRVAGWAVERMQAPEGCFYYQMTKRRIKRFTLMRWCNAWMAHGLSSLLEAEASLEAG